MSKRDETIGELIGNSITHGVGVLVGVFFLVFLVIIADTGLEIASALFFSIGVMFLFLMSTLYHALYRTKAAPVFKRFDHSAIYLMIYFSYMPFLLLAGEKAPNILAIILLGSITLIGVIFKSINPYLLHKFHLINYLLMGWISILYMDQISSYSTEAFILLVTGGVLYSLGAILYGLGRFKFAHAIWHIFVLLGIVSHFFSIIYLFGAN